jgi:hypothetical protein
MPIESFFYRRIVRLGRGREIVSAQLRQDTRDCTQLTWHPVRTAKIQICRSKLNFSSRGQTLRFSLSDPGHITVFYQVYHYAGSHGFMMVVSLKKKLKIKVCRICVREHAIFKNKCTFCNAIMLYIVNLQRKNKQVEIAAEICSTNIGTNGLQTECYVYIFVIRTSALAMVI